MFLSLALMGTACHAQGVFVVNEPWVRVAADGRSAEAYMRLTSTEGAKLMSAMSFAAERVVVLVPGHGKNATSELALPARQRVELAPGQYRILLAGLTRKLKLGARVALSLAVRNADGRVQEIPVDAEVRLRSPTDDEGHAHQPRGHMH